MFTINIYLRFALIALCLLGGTAMIFGLGFWYAFPFLLIGIILLIGYFLLGTVQSTAEKVQAMDFTGAEKQLGLTFFPNLLYKTNRAFYYMMKGTLAQQRGDDTDAENWLNKASEMELPTDNENAMVLVQLANIYAKKSQWNKTKAIMNKVSKLKITEPQLKEQVKQFEKAITNRGQMVHQQSMQMGRRKGGFRR
jgi:disulfide bond formation protein DsbB